jgi:hypothetical protein
MLKSCYWNGDMGEYLRQNSSHTITMLSHYTWNVCVYICALLRIVN